MTNEPLDERKSGAANAARNRSGEKSPVNAQMMSQPSRSRLKTNEPNRSSQKMLLGRRSPTE